MKQATTWSINLGQRSKFLLDGVYLVELIRLIADFHPNRENNLLFFAVIDLF